MCCNFLVLFVTVKSIILKRTRWWIWTSDYICYIYLKPQQYYFYTHTHATSFSSPTRVVLEPLVPQHVVSVAPRRDVGRHHHLVLLVGVERLVLGHAARGAQQRQGRHALTHRPGDVVHHVDA